MKPPGRKGREALISADGATVHIALPSDVTVDTASDFVNANAELLKAVAAEMGVPDLQVELGPMRIVCDGCGKERPSPHEGWTHTDTGHDYCEACS